MFEFILNVLGVILSWILYPVIALVFLYLVMYRIAWHFGCRDHLQNYVSLVSEWIRDAFRD